MKTNYQRLYFTCPIKALYMMKEFGVKFECKYTTEEIAEHEPLHEFYDFNEAACESNTIEDLLENLKNFRQVYVAPQSEDIFEPQEGDLDAEGFCFTKGMPVQNHMTGKIDYYTDACWLVKIEEFTRAKEKSKTIFRGDKQFFMPEVKNEN